MLLLLLVLLTGVQAQITADSVDVRLDWSDDGTESAASHTQRPAKLVAATYRNAYGTHFECSSTCMLLLVVYAVLVVGGMLLLSLIPVRFASNEKLEVPFVLWFGSPKKKKVKQEEEEEVQTESWWTRATAWVIEKLTTAPVPGTDVRYRFHADMTQQLAASAAAAKTYESIAVATDDLVEEPTVVKLQPPVKPASPPKEALPLPVIEVPPSPPPASPSIKAPSRSSLFMGAPPSVAKGRQPSSRLGSDTKAVATGPRTSRAGSREGVVETKEDLVRAVSRRQSIEMRTEKRVAVAKEDVSYENLRDDEIRTYEYLEFVRELLDGLSLKKVCQKSGRVVSRKLYITPDMTTIFWNPIGSVKWMRDKSSLQTLTIDQVLKGLHGSSSVTARSSPERDALCVSIGCSNGKWLVLEAKHEAMRQRLFLGFSRLAEEKQQESEAKSSEEAAEEKGAEVTTGAAEKKPVQSKTSDVFVEEEAVGSEGSQPYERQPAEHSPPVRDDPSFIHGRDVQSPADDVEAHIEEKPSAPPTEMTQPATIPQQPEDQPLELDEDTSPPRGTVVSKLWQSRMTTPAPLPYGEDLSKTGFEGDEPQIDVLAELMGLDDEQQHELEGIAAPPLVSGDSGQEIPQRESDRGEDTLGEATQEDAEEMHSEVENAGDNGDDAVNRPEEEQAVEGIEPEVGATDEDNSVGDPESSRE